MQVELRVLGTVDIIYGSTSVALRGVKPKQLLAALVLNSNTFLSVGRIIEALGPFDPPVSVHHNIRTYATAIRQRLRCSSNDNTVALLATTGGYLLRVPPEQVDVTKFVTHITSAREKRAAGDTCNAASDLTRALGIWRGSAGEGLPREGWLGNALLALDEQRLLAVEERVQLWLQLGRHTELVPELMSELTEQPLRESFWRYLMLAQYNSGRTSDALASYEKVRSVLAEHLGIDPWPALAELHQAILRHDPVLGRHCLGLTDMPVRRAATSPVNVLPTPRQLPAPPVDLADRRQTYSRITQVLREGASKPVTIAITGPPGIGKSALAQQVAHTVASEFSDGQLYVDLRELGQPRHPEAMLAVVRSLLRSLGKDDASFTTASEAAAHFRSSIAGRRLLVLIDNAVSARQVRYLLPAYPGSAAIITSCRQLDLSVVNEQVTLDPISLTGGMEILRRIIGDDQLRAETEAAKGLIKVCDGAPLALRAAGRHLTQQPCSAPTQHLYNKLSADPKLLDDLRFDGRRSAEPVAVALAELRAVEFRASAALVELSAVGGRLKDIEFSELNRGGARNRIRRADVDVLLDFHLLRRQAGGFVVPDVVRRQCEADAHPARYRVQGFCKVPI